MSNRCANHYSYVTLSCQIDVLTTTVMFTLSCQVHVLTTTVMFTLSRQVDVLTTTVMLLFMSSRCPNHYSYVQFIMSSRWANN